MKPAAPISAIPWAVACLALASCAVWATCLATARGIGLSPDSSAYLGAAQGILAGQGVAEPSADGAALPMTHYAPLYSVLLAAVAYLGVPLPEAARWLNSALFACNLLLAAILIEAETRSRASAVVGALLLLSSVAILRPHSMAWSEPAFLPFSLLAILWLARWAERPDLRPLLAAAGALALASLTRYAGLALMPAGIAVVALESRRHGRRVGRDVVLFAAVALLPIGLWLCRNWLATGAPTTRGFALHPPGGEALAMGLETVRTYLWPRGQRWEQNVAVAVLVGLALALGFGGGERPRRPVGAVVPCTLSFIASYLLFVLASMSFFDAATELCERILSPVYAWGVIAAVCVAHRRLRGSRRAYLLLPIGVGATAFALVQLAHTRSWLEHVRHQGQGYVTEQWRRSPMLEQVRLLPPETWIISNDAAAIKLLGERPSARLPEKFSPMTLRQNEAYAAELEGVRRRLAESGGVVVYFSRSEKLRHLPSASELRQRLGVRPVRTIADGEMYALE